KDLQHTAKNLFAREILPVLTPIGIDPSQPFPLIPNLELELLIRMKRNGKEQFAVMQVPSNVPRFLRLDDSEQPGGIFLASEELIAHNLEGLFRGYEILECTPFRITRDMDFSIDEESIADLLTEMQIALQSRPKRSVVRLEVAGSISDVSGKWLMKMLDVSRSQVIRINGLLNLKAMFQLAALPGFTHLAAQPMPPLASVACEDAKSMFTRIREKGSFITHLPYESFDPVVRLLEEAAEDPDVLAIKQTLYRVSKNSPVIAALEKAARNGKQVTVLFEIKARFDEENNMRGAMELAEAGAHVVYGIANLKVHCKALLIVRKEAAGIRRYVHLSTGNYNERTARQYTDIGYFSADNQLAQDVASLFNVITGFSDPPQWGQLLVAPYTMLERLLFLIDREARIATRNNPGHIILKVNSLIDYEVIEHLYHAAENNVKIEIIVRGICGINPYALSPRGRDNIRIVSILDRFLEHSRIYYFANNGAPEYFMGSADIMPRNLRRRIETLFPVVNPEIRAELDFILRTQLADRRKGRRMTGENLFSSTITQKKYESTRSQYVLYDYYRMRYLRFNDPERMKKSRLTVFKLKTEKDQ
ncbi:MAG: polyphosphate kinase 1, partial [Lentisphaeria bacterium]|nr:polyphosphate kinase 1 [Lentisphaeria bacterium]